MLKKAYETIRADLDAAARMQRSSCLLPARSTAFSAIPYFSRQVWWRATFLISSLLVLNSVGFYLLEVPGDGIPAAMFSVTEQGVHDQAEASSPLVAPI